MGSMSWELLRISSTPSVPRAAKGGIKAQSRRGKFGESWWAKRWIAVLESFNIGARLGRGRSYARRGQVLSIEIETRPGQGQGAGLAPQAVLESTIKVRTLSPGNDATAGQGPVGAGHLRGQAAGRRDAAGHRGGLSSRRALSSSPKALKDLETDCSCPDWSNPCKHIAAVYYLLGEEFDRDPFLIFKLRGVQRDKLIELLGEQAGKTEAQAPASVTGQETETAAPAEALDPASPQFWRGADLPPGWLGEVSPPPLAAALPKRLGNFPFWRANERLLDALTPIYTSASGRAQSLLLGEKPK